MYTLSVYGAASEKISDNYKNHGIELGNFMADNDVALCFGGGSTGMMGAIARGVREHNGTVIGVVPTFMGSMEAAFNDCTKIMNVDSMAERKSVMEACADDFLILPGGIGTLDEMFQIITQIYLKRKVAKIIIFNDKDIYGHFNEGLEQMVSEGFVNGRTQTFIIWCNTVEEVKTAISQLIEQTKE